MELEIGVCALSDYDPDGFPQVQTDSPGVDGSEGTQPAEMLLPHGDHARPLDPDGGTAPNQVGLGAPCLIVTMGDRRYAIPLQDPRDVIDGKVPKMKKGGRMISGGAGANRSFLSIDGLDPNGVNASGSMTLSVSFGTPKKSLAIALDCRTSGQESISLVHSEGQRVTLAHDRTVSIVNAKGDAHLVVGDDGIVANGDTKMQGSLTVGEQLAGESVVKWDALLLYLKALEKLLLIGNAGGPITVVLPIESLKEKIASQHLKAT